MIRYKGDAVTLSFLPIIEHELRVVSRRRSTFGVRASCAAVALFGTIFYVITDPVGAVSSSSGFGIFRAVSIFSAALCCVIPLVLASDCISCERRHGTLGLLILTGLKGHDIVLGKLIGVSVNAFFCLLAVLPALTLPFFFGGIGPGEFFRMSLALINLMLFSFAISVASSCFCKSARASLGLAVAGMLLCYLAVPLLPLSVSPAQAVFCAFDKTYIKAPSEFWRSLLCSTSLAWILIGFAGHRLPRMFRSELSRLPKQGNAASKVRERKILGDNPLQWLIMDSGLWTTAVWVVAVLLAAALAFAAVLKPTNPITTVIGWPIAGALVIFKLLFAQQSARFFAETRRSGELEALCATPLATEHFIHEQWKALGKLFLGPSVLLLVCYFVALHSDAFAPILALQARTSFVGLDVPLLSIYLVALYAFDLVAIGWFGMWLGFSLPKPQYAVVLTLLVGIVLPAVIFIFPHPLITLTMLVIGRARLKQFFRTGQFVPVPV